MFLISVSEEWSGSGEMVNPERSWSGVIIKSSERGEEIVGAPLRSHTLEPIDVVYTGCGAMRHDPHQ